MNENATKYFPTSSKPSRIAISSSGERALVVEYSELSDGHVTVFELKDRNVMIPQWRTFGTEYEEGFGTSVATSRDGTIFAVGGKGFVRVFKMNKFEKSSTS